MKRNATRRRRRWSPVQLPPLPSTGDGAVAPISPICVLWALDRCDAPADEVIPPPARGGVPSPRIRQPRPRGVGHTESRDVGQRRRGAVSDTRKSYKQQPKSPSALKHMFSRYNMGDRRRILPTRQRSRAGHYFQLLGHSRLTSGGKKSDWRPRISPSLSFPSSFPPLPPPSSLFSSFLPPFLLLP